MSDMTPVSRLEYFLAKIIGDDVELPEPQTDVELYLAAVAGETLELPPPASRWTLYLAKILGQNVILPVPQSRADLYLAKIAGEDVELPPLPLTRSEAYLALWAENGSGEIVTVTGTSPLVLANAMAHAIRKLVQYGKCSTVDGDIYCNNGKLVALDDELPVGYKRITGIEFDGDFYYNTGESLSGDDDVTMTLANTSTTGQNVFGSYNGTASGTKNFSLFIYGGGSQSNSYFRYGEQLLRPRFGTGERTITFGKSGTDGFATDVSGTPEPFTTPANAYIGMLPNSTSPAFTGSIIDNILIGTRLKYIPVERESDGVIGYFERVKGNFIAPTGSGTPVSLGYDTSHLNILSVEGTPEVLTIGTQTAHVEDLFEVGGVADEQDIISGAITRKVEVSVANGAISLSALATPVIEHTTPQPLSTVEGTNTVSWTAEVSGTVKEVEYAYEAPSFEWKTASGAVVNVSDAIAGEVGALSVTINPVQTGSGDPSPTNVRPISGWSNIDVWIQPTYDTSANPSATIPLGSTYYGGTLDVLTGELTVDRILRAFNGDAGETWAVNSSGGIWAFNIPNLNENKVNQTPMCNRFNAVSPHSYGSLSNGQLALTTSPHNYINIKTDVCSTVDAWRQWLSDNPLQIILMLATPQTVQLTPAQVSTLLGTNVIWASGNGEISVTYRAEASE